MKIVFLDRATIGYELNYSKLEELGEVKYYDTTLPNQTIDRIEQADIVITNKVILKEKELDAAKNLKLICVAATGYNNIDVEYANSKQIAVTNVKGYSTDSVAQQIFAYILAFYNSIFEFQNDIKQGKWQRSEIFTLLTYPIYELKNKYIGIIGYGAIGKKVAEIAKAFGMNILIAALPNRKYNEQRFEIDYVLRNSDIITLNIPLTNETRHIITLNELKKMKPSAILVNYARGGIVNEQDLYLALKNNIIRGAIVDVLTVEPPTQGNILFEAPNIFITPHTAWTSVEARQRLLDGIVENIRIYLDGKIEQIKIKN